MALDSFKDEFLDIITDPLDEFRDDLIHLREHDLHQLYINDIATIVGLTRLHRLLRRLMNDSSYRVSLDFIPTRVINLTDLVNKIRQICDSEWSDIYTAALNLSDDNSIRNIRPSSLHRRNRRRRIGRGDEIMSKLNRLIRRIEQSNDYNNNGGKRNLYQYNINVRRKL